MKSSTTSGLIILIINCFFNEVACAVDLHQVGGGVMGPNASLFESLLGFRHGSYKLKTPKGKWVFVEFYEKGKGGEINVKKTNSYEAPDIVSFSFQDPNGTKSESGYLKITKKSILALELDGKHDNRGADGSLSAISGAVEFDKTKNKIIQISLKIDTISAGFKAPVIKRSIVVE